LKDLLQVYGNISGWLSATASRTISPRKIGTLADAQGFPGRLLMQHKVGQPGGSNAVRCPYLTSGNETSRVLSDSCDGLYCIAVISDIDLIAALSIWELGTIVSVRRHGHGLNSVTWIVATDTDVWMAKAVPVSAAAQFTAGLSVAAHLEAAGLPAGAPRPTAMGSLSVAIADAQVAVLPFIAGRAIDPTNPGEQQIWGATLGRAHRILRSVARPDGVMDWHWVDVMAAHLDVEPWIRPAVQEAVAQVSTVQQRLPLTTGLLHADPGPSSFLVDVSGQVAVIDWGAVTWGPLLYDVASVAGLLGDDTAFHRFLSGYLSAAPLPEEELTALPTFVRFRWAVQADYFARRIWTHHSTGIADLSGNEQGLAEARRHLLGS
jgi:homoserine kinase type II